MNFIVGALKPFIFKQTIYVLNENGDILASRECSVRDLAENCVDLIKQYNVERVKLGGNAKYVNNYAKSIKELGLAKFENFNVEIEIMD